MTGAEQPSITLDAGQWAAALATLGDIEPVLAQVLADLNLRAFPGDARCGDRTAYVVLDVHGVSIGVQRRFFDLYLHADTSESGDLIIAFEANGTGEVNHPTGPRAPAVFDRTQRPPKGDRT